MRVTDHFGPGEGDVTDVVIDLGELPHGPQSRARPTSRPPLRVRPLLTFLAVALVAALTGAVHRPAVPGPAIIAARLGDTTFTARNLYFVVGASDLRATSPVQNKVISMYALPGATLLSRTPVAVSGAIMRVDAIGAVILLSQQVDTVGGQATTAVAAGSGRVLWRRPARLIGASPSGALVLLLDSGTDAGPLHWYGVEPSTGVARWAQEEPITGSTDLAYGSGDTPARLVTATVTGQLTVRDPETGTVTATAVVPAPAEWRRQGLNIWIVDDLLLLGGRGGVTAYDLADLRARWRSAVDLTEVFVLPVCGDAICFFGRFGGLKVVDPGTGLLRWGSTQWAAAQRVGPYLLARGSERAGGQQPLTVLDSGTGRERGTFGAWRPVGNPRPDGRIIGVRERPADQRVWYAMLDPAAMTVRVLGVADQVSGDCDVSSDVLVCRRLDSSVGVWQLSPS
jgi:hypothetical protein